MKVTKQNVIFNARWKQRAIICHEAKFFISKKLIQRRQK